VTVLKKGTVSIWIPEATLIPEERSEGLVELLQQGGGVQLRQWRKDVNRLEDGAQDLVGSRRHGESLRLVTFSSV
jgi:hypothetical protein